MKHAYDLYLNILLLFCLLSLLDDIRLLLSVPLFLSSLLLVLLLYIPLLHLCLPGRYLTPNIHTPPLRFHRLINPLTLGQPDFLLYEVFQRSSSGCAFEDA